MNKETDPVCGMQVDPREAAATSIVGDRVVYFCAEGCKDAFDASPGDFIHDGVAPGAGCCSAGRSCH